MESHKKFYKATKPTLTLSERVRKDRTRQNLTRKDKFNANRKLPVDLNESTGSPSPQKLSSIRDKSKRLQTYIERKRTAKLKEKLDERPPFVPYVPVGRWIEKSEPLPKPKAFVIDTPVRNALMSDGKIFKKSTIAQIALATTTAKKKENAGHVEAATKKDSVKSKRKILAELNVAPPPTRQLRNSAEKQKPSQDDVIPAPAVEERIPSLDETYELLENNELQEDSVFEMEKTIEIKAEPLPVLEADKNVGKSKDKQAAAKKSSRAKIVVPVRPVQQNERKPKRQAAQKLSKATEKAAKKPAKKPSPPPKVEPVEEKAPSPPQPAKKSPSHTYKFYTSSIENQVDYITIQISDIVKDVESYTANLSEEMQALVYQTVQQADMLVKDKFKAFEEVLEKFENSESAGPRITSDDVENYWDLLYEQISKFKESLNTVREAKIAASKELKKRRTTRTHTLAEVTPSRRSRRIAETGDTPKHSASCFGCTPLSKVNTPKSAKRRRTTFKKSIAFDQE